MPNLDLCSTSIYVINVHPAMLFLAEKWCSWRVSVMFWASSLVRVILHLQGIASLHCPCQQQNVLVSVIQSDLRHLWSNLWPRSRAPWGWWSMNIVIWVIFDCINLFQWLLTESPEGPGAPETPDSPRGPCAPSGPLAPVGPASPYEGKYNMRHSAWARLFLLKISNIFKCHFQSLGCTFICINVVINLR